MSVRYDVEVLELIFSDVQQDNSDSGEGVEDVSEEEDGEEYNPEHDKSSYELGQQLLKRKITMVGTVRKNKPELLPALLSSKEREVFSSKFAFMAMTTVVSYLSKKNKNVVLMSTLTLVIVRTGSQSSS